MKKNFKILINSSKTLNINEMVDKKENFDIPFFFEKNLTIAQELIYLSEKQISKNFKISEKVAKKTFEYFQKYNQKLYPAIKIYDGTFFKQLNLNSYDLSWLSEHVLIIDAFYGILKPFDLISPYRLDFKYKNLSFDLYDFWKESINNYLNEFEIYSLASQEFTNLLEKSKYVNLLEKFNLKTKKQRGQKFHEILLKKSL
ncbi:peroxide stress protein YaaA [[Mycoplasma] mobile]|uniref:Uncharacterized protein n=1 Tax=Mycoplasma mobile (strain ATCC 43663 / 163K / NCTC 11711) TaxID=267748 RepID=Q6KH60_MYCM1|nr:peroxide stress protein YaaA [[Mycoplasma] mobile]AAT28071.1 conserved hypothetical protein [Mycoplasma mobile 163K]